MMEIFCSFWGKSSKLKLLIAHAEGGEDLVGIVEEKDVRILADFQGAFVFGMDGGGKGSV